MGRKTLLITAPLPPRGSQKPRSFLFTTCRQVIPIQFAKENLLPSFSGVARGDGSWGARDPPPPFVLLKDILADEQWD